MKFNFEKKKFKAVSNILKNFIYKFTYILKDKNGNNISISRYQHITIKNIDIFIIDMWQLILKPLAFFGF